MVLSHILCPGPGPEPEHGEQQVSAPVPVQVQCERLYIKPYNRFIHVSVLDPVPVPETSSVTKPLNLRNPKNRFMFLFVEVLKLPIY